MTTYYKGFDKDLKCRGFQYVVGESYAEEHASLCNTGFHACENPLDIWSYYPPNTSRYCVVELEEVDRKREEDTKVCARKINIVRELCTKEFSQVCADYMALQKFEKQASGYAGHAQASGKNAVAVSIGINGGATANANCRFIVLSEHDNQFNLLAVKVGIVGVDVEVGKKYCLNGGKFVEVTD